MSEPGSALYYMAPMCNAPLIALSGILSYNQVKRITGLASQSIADPFVNSRRHRRSIGGRSLHDYVPLYWAVHTPMQYVVTVKECRLPQADLVFFIIDAMAVFQLEGVFSTDGNAASNETVFYEGDGAVAHLDWRILRTPNCWSKEYKRRKCAEVLVPDWVSVECMRRICVFDQPVAARLRRSVNKWRKLTTQLKRRLCPTSPDPNLYY